jgi:hypothetical protein
MEKKEKIKNWLKNPYNVTFLFILIFAIVLRLYYFSITINQPIWWDESDYLAYAKNLAGFHVDWIVTEKHNSIYPFLVATFFKIGFTEPIIKFILQIIPSILSVLLVYKISNKMYNDKRVGLIAAFILSVFWVHLFNTMRFHIDILALFTGLLAIYVFWDGYEDKSKIFGKISHKWAIPLTVFLVILTYSIRRGYFLFGFFFLIYLLSTNNWKNLLKDKNNWIGLILGLSLLFLTENFIFTSNVSSLSQGYFHVENPITFLPIQVFNSFYSNISNPLISVLLYLFWAGFFILLLNIIFSYGHIKKIKKTKADLFNIITIFITLFLFIFILRSPESFGEPRWYFPLALASFICISKSSVKLMDLTKNTSKYFPILLIIIILGFGGYYELKHSDGIIRNKIDSYTGIKESSIFLNEISQDNDIIITTALPQTAYYSERSVVHPRWWTNWTDYDSVPFDLFLNKIKENPDVRYLIISFSEPNHPLWMRNKNPQTTWEIPFMDTKIDFTNQMQDIKQSKTFEGVTFNLIEVKNEIFIYRISR